MLKLVSSSSIAVVAASLFAVGVGCSKDSSPPTTQGSSSASAATTSAPASTSASANASASASAEASAPEPHHDCPDKSSGVGSLASPCLAKGSERMMTVKSTKNDEGDAPAFSITNKSKLVIVYGKIAVYFYDKAGKQLDLAPDAKGNARHYHSCSGLFFQGVMNPGENAVLTFSCVPKSVVPEGTATIEAEMETVGFADASGQKVDFYWRNPDLAPDARKKGGK